MKEKELNKAQGGTGGTSEPDFTQEQALAWLRGNRDFLNLKNIARHIECSPSTLTVSVAGGKDSRGYNIPFPARCLPAMQALINRFSE